MAFAIQRGMMEDDVAVNCGRCGRALVVTFDYLRDKRTVECDACERQRCQLADSPPRAAFASAPAPRLRSLAAVRLGAIDTETER